MATIEIKDISGKTLMTVPVSSGAISHEELMKSDYIQLEWNSPVWDILPAGAFIEYEGEKYGLLEPYKPTCTNEAEYQYTPQFQSRIMAWDKHPVPLYTYDEEGSVVGREFDWEFTGSPADVLYMVKQAIMHETGEEWTYQLSDSLPVTVSLQSQSSSIFSVLSELADLCETEWWVDKKNNFLHLSKCEYGEPVMLTAGQNVKMPSITNSKDGYYTRFYVFGSTKNITQDYQSGQATNHIVNKRLTLDPLKYPGGFKDIKGHFENGVFVSDLLQGEIFPKTLYFDEVFPSSRLTISNVRPRAKYRLDSNGNKIQIGGSEDEPVYEQYAIWYFRVEGFDFDPQTIIEGTKPSVSFESGQLAGRDFELIYHEKDQTVKDAADVTAFNVKAGDYEIIIDESTGSIIPGAVYIIPQDGDKIVLYNIEMPDEYTTSAQVELEAEINKEIARRIADNNTYEFDSNPVDFYNQGMDVVVGQSVHFSFGGSTLETRVLMVEKRLDGIYQQRIRIGNEQIKGVTQELKEDVADANQSIDVIKAFNELSSALSNAYANAQREMIEGFAAIKNMWQFDKENENTIFSAFNVYSKGWMSAKGIDKGEEEGTGGATTIGQLVNVGEWADQTPAYDRIMVQLAGSTHWTEKKLSEIGGGLDEEQLATYLTENNYAKTSDIPSLEGYATETWVTDKGYITSAALTGYATQSWVLGKNYATTSDLDARIDALVNGAPAAYDTLKEIADVLQGNVDSIGDILTTLGTKADKTITITAGTGLTGGGNLSANRTISLKPATTTALGGIIVGERLSIDASGVLSATYTYTHPSATATTISAATGKVLSAITVNNLGHVTSVTAKTLAEADIPTLQISKISGLQNELDSKLDQSIFNDLFEKVEIRSGVYAIRAKYGLYSNEFISAKGMDEGEEGGGSGSSYLSDLLDVSLTSLAANDLLKWNGTKWVNVPMSSIAGSTSWDNITGKPTTIKGYGITATDILTTLKTVDGSGSGLDADLLDGLDSLRFFHGKNNKPSGLMSSITGNGCYSTTGSLPEDAPDGAYGYGNFVIFDAEGSSANGGAITQIYFPHNGASPCFRTTYARDANRYHNWYKLARTIDNVASASKLQTARTIWGQSFDGTKNVSGAIIGATTINASGAVTFGSTLSVTGLITATAGLTTPQYLQIGDGRIYWDATNKALYVKYKDGTTAIGFYSLGWMSAKGVDSGTGGSTGGGNFFGVIVNGSTYRVDDEGYVTIPDYPTSLNWSEISGKPSWIGSTKPSYAFSEITGKPTTLSGYGITDGVNDITVSGSGNAVTSASISGHKLTLTKGSTFLLSSQYTASDILTKLKTVDGKDSGLDADLLDGYHGTAYDLSTNLGYCVDYGYYVIGLLQITDYTKAGNHANGRLSFIRTNGNNRVQQIQYSLSTFYNTINVRFSYIALGEKVAKPCTFTYNSKKWAGFVVKMDSSYLNGVICTRFGLRNSEKSNPFLLKYYTSNTETINNSEVYNSLIINGGDIIENEVSAGNFVGNLSGNASSASKLETSRSIWGQSFDGTANVSGALTGVTNITASGSITAQKMYITGTANSNAYITADTSYNMYFVANGLSLLSLDGSQKAVRSGSGYASQISLGTATVRWSNLYSVAGNFSGDITANRIKITDTDAVRHIEFSRTSYNYLTAPAGTDSSINFIVNGQDLLIANADLSVRNGLVCAGTTNATSLGNSTYRWSGLYSVLGNFSGAVTIASTLAVTGALIAKGGVNFNGSQLTNVSRIEFQPGDAGRKTVITNGGSFLLYGSTGGWAAGLGYYGSDGTTNLGNAAGAYGSGNTLNYYYYGGTYSSPKMVMLPNGYVGIGLTAPTQKLHVSGNILATGAITAKAVSDIRLKTILEKEADYRHKLLSLGRIVDFYYNDKAIQRNTGAVDRERHTGLIYQSAKELGLPNFCHTDDDGYGAINYLCTDYINLVAGALQQTILRQETIEQRVERLERENEELKRQLNNLTAA